MQLSVLTLVRGRRDHLVNQMLGLNAQTRKPDELIIAYMQPEGFDDLPEVSFDVRCIYIEGDELPLAKARNRAAQTASGEYLVFLDVDCIPAPTCLNQYLGFIQQFDGVLMGDVRYLSDIVVQRPFDWDILYRQSQHHAERRAPPDEGIEPCHDFRCFWSLSFAIPKRVFMASGGFDEDFTGYGAEDTDFGKILDTQGIKFGWCAGACVFHQFHEQHMPPVHQVDSILRNNRLYKKKWGTNTMEHWLGAFIELGLIKATSDDYELIRRAGEYERSITRQQPDMPYASTRLFMERLQNNKFDQL